MFRKASDTYFYLKRRYKMVASRHVEIPFYRGNGRQRGRWFGALAQVIGRTAIPFLRKNVVPAAKCVGADLLQFAAPEISDVVGGRKKFKTAAKSLGRQTLRKQLGSGSRKRKWAIGGKQLAYGRQASGVIATKSAKQKSRLRRQFYKHCPLIMSSNFRYQPSVTVSGNLGG